MAIIWNEQRMATGIQEVDEQHIDLIRHFNEFHEAMAHGKGQATAIRLLVFLADYTETHFTCEEGWMTSLNLGCCIEFSDRQTGSCERV